MTSDPVERLCYSTPQFASLYEGWEETGRDGSVRFVRVHSKVFARSLMLAVDPSSANVPALHAVIKSKYGALRAYGSFVRNALAWVEVEVPTTTSARGKAARKKGASERQFTDEQLFEFASYVLDFTADGIYREFLAHMLRMGYSERECEAMTTAIGRKTGRTL